jgi:hypothetical protein
MASLRLFPHKSRPRMAVTAKAVAAAVGVAVGVEKGPKVSARAKSATRRPQQRRPLVLLVPPLTLRQHVKHGKAAARAVASAAIGIRARHSYHAHASA